MSSGLPPIEPRPRAEGLPPLAPRPERGPGLPPLDPPPPAGPLPPLAGRGGEGERERPAVVPKRRVSRRRIGLVAAVAAGLVLAGGAGALVGGLVGDDEPAPQPVAQTPAATSTPPALGAEADLADAVARVQTSVVQVQTSAEAQGSGVILAPSGLVVTNYHVIQAGGSVSVVTSDGREVPAEVVEADPRQDLAILRPEGAVPGGAELAEEPDGGLRQGDRVFAIGSPFGLPNTVTAGVVSAVSRTNPEGVPMIQIDAPINPGNSGGGLFDLRGRLVGIPTSILGPIPGNVGIGFAVPASRVRELVAGAP